MSSRGRHAVMRGADSAADRDSIDTCARDAVARRGCEQEGGEVEKDKDVRIPKLTEDDIVAFLTMFERVMTAFEIQKEFWAFKLASNLVGKAHTVYALMSVADANSYDKLEVAILWRYNISEKSY